MSNYTKTTNFGAKDTLPSGDSQKIIRGTEFDTEFNNIATAIATKLEVDGSNNLAISGTFSSTKLIPTGGTATGNGMYLPAANAVAISTNGTERLRIDSSGVASFASNPILNGGTANGLVYLDGSKVATSGSAVTFDGTNLATTGTASATKLIPTGGTATGNGMYLPAANTLALSTNGVERARVDSSGNLGVGTTSPGSRLDVQSASSANAYRVANIYNSAATGTTAGSNILLRVASNGSGADSTLVLTDSTSTNGFISNNNGNLLFGNGLGFTERMRLDSSGNLGIGVTPSAWNSATKNIQNPAGSLFSINTTDSGVSQNLFLDSTGTWKYVNTAAASYFAQSSGSFVWTSVGSGTAGATASLTTKMTLDSSGNLGLGVTPSAWNSGGNFQLASGKNISAGNGIGLYANGYFDGAWKYINSVGAAGYVQSANEHIWYTAPSGTAGNAITFTQAMTLDASGNLGVGSTAPVGYSGYSGVTVQNTNGGFINLRNGANTNQMEIAVEVGNTGYVKTVTSIPLIFGTNNTERARITSGGDFLVGTTTLAGAAGISFQTGGTTGLALINNNNAAATGYVFSSFRRSGVEIGSITQNGTTAVLFNTTSDRRLKENIVSAPSASDVIDAIEIVSHDWKAAPDEHVTYGVIAQDLALVAPQAVLQGDNNDEIEKVWGVDYSKLVPILIKELQSLRARVATLENN